MVRQANFIGQAEKFLYSGIVNFNMPLFISDALGNIRTTRPRVTDVYGREAQTLSSILPNK